MRRETKCHVDPITHRASQSEREDAVVTRLGLAGLGCPNCANRVRNSLLGVSGVVDAEVDLPDAVATVWHEAEATDVSVLIGAVADAARGTRHRYVAFPLPIMH